VAKQSILHMWDTPSSKLDKEQYVKLVKRFRMLAAFVLVGSLGVFLAVALFGGFSNVVGIIGRASPILYALAFVCVFFSFCFRYLKWNYYTKKLGLKVPHKKNFLVYLSTNGMAITPGNVGSVVAAYTLKKITGVRFSKIAPMITVQLFTDFFGFALFALAAALIIGRYIAYVVILDIVLIVPFLLIINPWLFNLLKKKKKKGNILKRVYRHARHYYISQNVLNNKKTYLVSLLFTTPADILNSMALYFSILAVGIKPQIIKSIFVFSTSQIFGMITALPGGIGAADASFVALLGSTFKFGSATSSAITIMTRLATLWFGVALGIIALIYTIRYWSIETKRSR
jgi:glycosyltransferase 2 family protein